MNIKNDNKIKEFKSGLKKDNLESKIDFTLIPLEILTEIAEQFTNGAIKYKKNNWRLGKGEEIDIFDQAAFRHLVKYIGKVNDGESHGIACITNLIMAEWHRKYKYVQK